MLVVGRPLFPTGLEVRIEIWLAQLTNVELLLLSLSHLVVADALLSVMEESDTM